MKTTTKTLGVLLLFFCLFVQSQQQDIRSTEEGEIDVGRDTSESTKKEAFKDQVERPEVTEVSLSACRPMGWWCSKDSDCCSDNCFSFNPFLKMCVPAPECKEPEKTCSADAECCDGECYDYNEDGVNECCDTRDTRCNNLARDKFNQNYILVSATEASQIRSEKPMGCCNACLDARCHMIWVDENCGSDGCYTFYQPQLEKWCIYWETSNDGLRKLDCTDDGSHPLDTSGVFEGGGSAAWTCAD